jgi:hypothetical protein
MNAAVYGIDEIKLKEKRPDYSKKKFSQRYFGYDKIHREWTVTEPCPPR